MYIFSVGFKAVRSHAYSKTEPRALALIIFGLEFDSCPWIKTFFPKILLLYVRAEYTGRSEIRPSWRHAHITRYIRKSHIIYYIIHGGTADKTMKRVGGFNWTSQDVVVKGNRTSPPKPILCRVRDVMVMGKNHTALVLGMDVAVKGRRFW